MSDGLTGERWLPVVGYEDRYLVSDQGRVWTVPRRTVYKDGRSRMVGGAFKTTFLDPKGYIRVGFKRRDGASRTALVYQWVAAAFIGPRPEGMHTCHIDGNKLNNTPANLRYDTASSNNYDLVDHGTHYWARRDRDKRGHLFAPPNVRWQASEAGRRICIACSRAHGINAYYRKSGRAQQDFDRLADAYYREIMGPGGDPEWEAGLAAA